MLEYQERFEDLRSKMLKRNPTLNETYFINSFISGLDDEIQPVLMMLKPPDLTNAFLHARIEEASIEARKKKFRSLNRWTSDNVETSRKPPLTKPIVSLAGGTEVYATNVEISTSMATSVPRRA
ncbi:hypothetical protein LINPERHAP1_LOCUS29356 [Linum perenne]